MLTTSDGKKTRVNQQDNLHSAQCSMNIVMAQRQLCSNLQVSHHCFGLARHMVESPKNKTVGSHFQQTASNKLTVRYLPSMKWWRFEVNKQLVKRVEHLTSQKQKTRYSFSQELVDQTRNKKKWTNILDLTLTERIECSSGKCVKR